VNRRIILAIGDEALAGRTAALAEEAGVAVAGRASDADELTALLHRTEPDAVLVHEDLGPLPVLELTRRLAAQHPTVGFLLVARDAQPDLLRQALRAGVRDVLALPLTVEALAEAMEGAAAWSSAVRERMDAEQLRQVAEHVGGRVVALAGAKGGVGTTTIAVHLALAAVEADRERTVCLAELDLQTGDVRALLDLTARRSVVDLVGVADEISQRSLDDTLYVHPSGLRVLLAPQRGEDGEDVTGVAARGILGALKFQYDLVICDVGSVMTEASAVAVESADEVVVVTTSDVPALRAANRLLELWQRLGIRPQGDARVLLNRVSKDLEIQPEFARKVVAAPVLEAAVPAGFAQLEPALNAGAPDRLEPGAVRRVIARAGEELGALPQAAPRRRLRLRTAVRAEAGQAMTEAVGMLTLMAVVVLGLWQLVLVGYTDVLASHSSREAARAWAVGEGCLEPARRPLPAGFRKGMRAIEHDDGVEVRLQVPLILPGVTSGLVVADRKRIPLESRRSVTALLGRDTTKGEACEAGAES
jgi:pilus assembly protein CpaE